MVDTFPDWTRYSHFEWNIFVPESTPSRCVLRAHDRYHDVRDVKDRFRRDLELKPGFHTIRVDLQDISIAPNGRELDMHLMKSFALYFPKLDREIQIFVGEPKLIE